MTRLPTTVGLGWRPQTAWMIDQSAIDFSEIVAEAIDPKHPPRALAAAVERGLVVIPHGTGLSLGSTTPPDRGRVRRLAQLAKVLRAPLVSEHVAVARSGELASPHFLPVPYTRAQLALLVDHVRRVIDELPVPLALENVAAPFTWPGNELAEADFLAELVDRTGALLLLDVANLHTNMTNHDTPALLDRLPLDRVAYLHVAGGARIDQMWRDTHAHPIAAPVLDLLREVLAATGPKPILLERDHGFDDRPALERELEVLRDILAAAPAAMPAPRDTAHRPLSQPSRDELAAAHEALLRSLLHDDRTPAGFSAVHLAETRSILRAKHRR